MQIAHFLYFFGEIIVGIICFAGVMIFSNKQRKQKRKRDE